MKSRKRQKNTKQPGTRELPPFFSIKKRQDQTWIKWVPRARTRQVRGRELRPASSGMSLRSSTSLSMGGFGSLTSQWVGWVVEINQSGPCISTGIHTEMGPAGDRCVTSCQWGKGKMIKCDQLWSSLIAASLLARPINFGMHNAHMPCKGIIPTEGLLFGAQVASDLKLARIVDRIFVPSQIVRSREDRIARLSSRWVDALALVRSSLRVA